MSVLPLQRRLPWLALCLCLLGCGDADRPTTPADPIPAPVFAADPDAALTAFRDAYAARDYAAYEAAIVPRFLFMSPDCAHRIYIWRYARECRSTRSLFAGEKGYDRVREQPVPAIRELRFERFRRVTDWTRVPTTDRYYPDTTMALVEVILHAVTEAGDSLHVKRTHAFFVRNDPVEYFGETTDRWRVDGHYEFAPTFPMDKSSGATAWGDLKAWFWYEPPTGED